MRCDNGLASFREPHHIGCVACEVGFIWGSFAGEIIEVRGRQGRAGFKRT